MIKRLDIKMDSGYSKVYLIGDGTSFIEAPKHIKEQEGVWDYLYYTPPRDEEIAIPTIRPLTYNMEDFSYSPTLSIEERKDKIIQSWELKGYEVEVLRWEEVSIWNEPLSKEEFDRRLVKHKTAIQKVNKILGK